MKNIVTVFIIALCFCFFSNDVHAQFFSPPVFNHEAAAKAGYGDGLCIRGLSSLVDNKYSEAYKYLYQAYDECDNAKAAAYLGIMFEHGLGVSVNRDTAKSLYTWSQKKGDSFGAGNLARINQYGFNDPTPECINKVLQVIRAREGMNSSSGYIIVPPASVDNGSSSSSGNNRRRLCPSCKGGCVCSVCGGKGEYWIETGMFTGRDTKKLITCSTCRGTKHCGVCRGNGYINF